MVTRPRKENHLSVCHATKVITITKNRANDNLNLFQIPSPLHQSTENSKPSQSMANIIKSPPINRVRLAIEALERNSTHFSRERKP
jgi:hypothetical protein